MAQQKLPINFPAGQVTFNSCLPDGQGTKKVIFPLNRKKVITKTSIELWLFGGYARISSFFFYALTSTFAQSFQVKSVILSGLDCNLVLQTRRGSRDLDQVSYLTASNVLVEAERICLVGIPC